MVEQGHDARLTGGEQPRRAFEQAGVVGGGERLVAAAGDRNGGIESGQRGEHLR